MEKNEAGRYTQKRETKESDGDVYSVVGQNDNEDMSRWWNMKETTRKFSYERI